MDNIHIFTFFSYIDTVSTKNTQITQFIKSKFRNSFVIKEKFAVAQGE